MTGTCSPLGPVGVSWRKYAVCRSHAPEPRARARCGLHPSSQLASRLRLATSCLAKVSISPTGLSGAGFDLYLRDSLNINTNVALMTLTATDLAGLPIIGASVSVFGDEQKDGEGNYMIGFSPTSQTSGFGESPSKQITAGTTPLPVEHCLSRSVRQPTAWSTVARFRRPAFSPWSSSTACGAVPTRSSPTRSGTARRR